MCETCGCGQPGDYTVNERGHHEESHHHDHDHSQDHGHDHHPSRQIELNRDILSENNLMAERNRGFFEGKNILCFNLVSSPGSGKTTLLEKTLLALGNAVKMSVIEGDQQTTRDSDRIERAGAPAVQVNTGYGCHLDAHMVNAALKKLDLKNHSVLFIENVGNLVCPALFDLGEKRRVLVVSVTEGEDKPLKYPYMFASSHLCIINKSDLLPYVDFNVEKFKEYALRVNPHMEFMLLSAKTGEGLEVWTKSIYDLRF